MTERATGAGNMSQIVFELAGDPGVARLRQEFAAFAERVPVIAGRTTRAWNLAPCWRSPATGTAVPFRIEERDIRPQASETEILEALQAPVNTPFFSPCEHLRMCLLRVGSQRSLLTLVFDHRLLDARGAEAFMAVFQRWYESRDDDVVRRCLPPPQSAELRQWGRKFKAGHRANRFLHTFSRLAPRYLPLPSTTEGVGFRFRLVPFSEAESRGVFDAACEGAGYLMLMPYVLAAVVRGMHGAFERRGVAAPDYVIPVSVDMRPPDKAEQTVFFNHMSFFLFRVVAADLGDNRARLFGSLRRQLYDQMKVDMPRDLCTAASLLRIAPLPLMNRLVRLPLKGQMGSYCFAYVGDMAYPAHRLLDVEVRNLFHMPRVPLPPGLGFFFSNYHGRLNGVLSYLAGVLSEAEADGIARDAREALASRPL